MEISSNYENDQKIPYEELLNTEEWKFKRDTILHRDKDCCTKCGKTNSILCNDYKVKLTIDTNDCLSKENIGKESCTIDYAIKELEFGKIIINDLKILENSLVGISDNKSIILMDSGQFEYLENTKREDILINKCTTKLGREYFILSISGKDLNFQRISIPVITENNIALHVHHKFYIVNKLPWEYEDDDLTTLCNVCHMNLHEKTIIPIYKIDNGCRIGLNYSPCSRCNGVGYFPEYKHVDGGLCFKCHGERYEELITLRSII